MKTVKHLLLAALTAGLFASKAGLAADAPAANPPTTPATTETAKPVASTPAPAPAASDQTPQPPASGPTSATGQAAATPEAATATQPATAPVQDANSAAEFAAGKGLRFNFRGVPLEMVLNYLSTAGGYIIHLKPNVELKGKVDAWSNQPLSKEEALNLVEQVLNDNGYTAFDSGRTLTILKSSEARTSDIRVLVATNTATIPKNLEIVTEIIPVRSLNAVQLIKDLQPLLASDNSSTLTANESGNSLVMTDTQINIHRIAEIVKALDSVTSSVNSIRVFSLHYADAKTLATLIKDLFAPVDSSRQGGNGGGNFGRFQRGGGGGGRGGGGGGGFGNMAAMLGGGDPGGGDPASTGHTPTAHVSATSDDNSNSLIVSAPDDVMESIAGVVSEIDTPLEDVAAMKVFHLKNSDAGEMADLLSSLYPDESTSNNSGRQGNPFSPFGFGGRFGFPGAQGNNNTASVSERLKRLGRVTAVPDRRTGSLIVTASTNLMDQISMMITNLDENPAKKQRVYVYSLQNAEVQDVQPVLQALFPTGSSSPNSSAANLNQQNALTTRSTSMQQNQNSQSGTSSFGSPGSNGRTGF